MGDHEQVLGGIVSLAARKNGGENGNGGSRIGTLISLLIAVLLMLGTVVQTWVVKSREVEALRQEMAFMREELKTKASRELIDQRLDQIEKQIGRLADESQKANELARELLRRR